METDRRADYEAGTPTSTLIEAVGRDAAVSILLWLTDIYDTHVLEYDDKLLSPSVEWLLQSVRDGLAGTCQCPIDAETGRVGRNPGCPSHGYTDHTPTEHIDGQESPAEGRVGNHGEPGVTSSRGKTVDPPRGQHIDGTGGA